MRVWINPKEVDNQKIAWILRLVAAAYTIKGGPYFKIIAYNNAADEIEHLTTPIVYLWQQNRLDEIPNVGESIKTHLQELLTTGRSKHFDKLLKDIHPAVGELIKIPGIGAKIAYKLTTAFKFPKGSQKEVIEHLIRLGKEGKIQKLPGFKEKSEQRLIRLASEYLSQLGQKRFLLSEALEVAEPLIKFLLKCKTVKEASVLGSLRRRLPTVGDIDIAVKTDKPKEVIDQLKKYKFFKEFEVAGSNKARMVLTNGYKVDVVTSPSYKFGSLLQHLTGSKFHNIALRELALEKGLSMSEHGIKDLKTNKVYHFDNEAAVYDFLGLDWIPPELRENKGEIEAAAKHAIPKLLDLEDIQGDWHVHSNFNTYTSHDVGKSTIDDLVTKAKLLDYKFIAITDHNPNKQLSLDKKRQILSKRGFLINKIKQKTGFVIFNGLEVDINPDGSLAIEEELLEMLDFVIVSIHSRFDLDPTKMTQRIIKALSYPKVKILGHPTARLLNRRKGIEANWEKIFDYIKNHNQAVEVNASPYRLDLPDDLIKLAVKKGVFLSLGTDAHEQSSLDWMRFGIWNARRGWVRKENVVNTWGMTRIEKWINENKS